MKLKEMFRGISKRLVVFSTMAMVMVMCTVPAFASSVPDTGIIDATLFDPLVSGITGNITSILPKVVVVVGLCIGLGVCIALFKKHAKPG